MTAPTFTPTAAVLWDWLGPALTGDDPDGVFAWIIRTFAAPLEEVEAVARGRDGRVGWQAALDPDVAPEAILGWVGQWVGETFPDTLPAAERRARLLNPSGWYRATPDAVRRTVREHLVGSRRVSLTERYGGDPFVAEVRVYASQAPDTTAVERAAQDAVPAGIRIVLTVLAGQTWDELQADHATWADVTADYATWDELLEDV